VTRFHYKAVTSQREVLEGEMQAADKHAVVDRLHELGHVPIVVAELAGPHGSGAGRRRLFQPRRASQRQVAMFTEELATLLKAGLPLDRALQLATDLADEDRVRQLLGDIRDEVRAGTSLADAMEAQGVFTHFYINMIRAGEAGGALDVVLGRLAEFMSEISKLKESVKSALVYPAILVTVAGLSVIILLTYVVPQFTVLFEQSGKALPLPTRIVIATGEYLRSYWWLPLMLVGGLVYYLRRQFSDPARRYRWDRWLLRMPLVGDLVTKTETTRFARTLGTLLDNGVAVLTALSIVKETIGNRVMAEGVGTVAVGVKEGQGLAGPMMKVGVFPRLAVHMVQVGEETGRLNEMLLRIADTYDSRVHTAIQRMLTLLEPALILGLGVIVAGIIMSILMAVLSINSLAM